MIVHFTASKSDVADNIASLRNAVAAIHADGHTLSLDWIEPAFTRQNKEGKRPIDWAEVFKDTVEALTKSDVVIADTTFNSFGVGYQVAIALQQKKPILLLRRKTADPDAFAKGAVDSVIKHIEYANDKELANAIKSFLEENDIQTKDMRFNFFIDRPIYNYLRWAAHKTGKTKAEILRDLVVREIDKETKP